MENKGCYVEFRIWGRWIPYNEVYFILKELGNKQDGHCSLCREAYKEGKEWTSLGCVENTITKERYDLQGYEICGDCMNNKPGLLKRTYYLFGRLYHFTEYYKWKTAQQ